MIEISTQGNKQVLLVDGAPFIMIAGEVHNSDSSSPAYMEGIWDQAQGLGMNTLLLPVSWEMTEPAEGSFDFSVPQTLIDQARARGMRIVFLWFGSWKNAECMYAPEWVKRDLNRFPRAQIDKGKNKTGRRISPSAPVTFPYTSLSYLGEETCAADCRAFATLMRFLKEYDGAEQTVLAVQVENETGLLGAAREQSDLADQRFAADAPQDFIRYMRENTASMTPEIRAAVERGAHAGSWREVFGDAAEEIFSAYHVAGFVGAVARAGKKEYPLPMAVNCWLDKGGAPGTYPTGGPVSKVREVWRYRAPAIDLYAPDIYVPSFGAVCDEYTRRGEALFIPETATHSYCAPRLAYVIGHYHAACYSPFGFDDFGKPFSAVQGFLFGMDTTDPALKTPQDPEEYRRMACLLREMTPLLAPAYGSDRLQAVSAETDPARPHPSGDPSLPARPGMSFGAFRVEATFDSPFSTRRDGVCLCLQVGAEECYVAGSWCGLRFQSLREDAPNLDFALIEEGTFENGVWKPGRRLNGDEAAQLELKQPAALHIKMITYP